MTPNISLLDGILIGQLGLISVDPILRILKRGKNGILMEKMTVIGRITMMKIIILIQKNP